MALSACNKGTKIVVDDIDSFCDSTMFRGIKPDMYYDDLVAVVGEPNDYEDIKDGEDTSHNPVYYFKEGKVKCWWSGSKRDEIGVIVYTPYLNTHIYINNIIKKPIADYEITPETKKVEIYKGDTLYFIITLDNLEVKEIHFSMFKKKSFL